MNLRVRWIRKGSLTFISLIFLLLVALVLDYQLKTVNIQIHCNNLRIRQMEQTRKD